ncbi:MAG: TetR family transcriptional regulator [Sporolactobacillus sp.]|nr:TetR family transcriptional regulator [Sporolactobacillus sp.]
MDQIKRREKVAEACWRVIKHKGIEQASVREIAREAGLSVGALRHYFSSQQELFIFSMELVTEKVGKRIEKLTFTGEPIADAIQILSQVMPVDAQRRLEMEAWYAFTSKALHDPDLQAMSRKMYEDMYRGCWLVVDRLSAASDKVKRSETDHLYALVDGLAVHTILQPELMTAQRALTIVEHYLHAIHFPSKAARR